MKDLTIFFIEGGIGRVICSIPSLLKFHHKNPNKKFYIISSWDYVFLGIPELQQITFNIESKGIWENIFLKADKVISPEPYRLPKYYKQQISLVDAFDEIINETEDHSDIQNYMRLKVSFNEDINSKEIISSLKEERGNKKTIVINPYGSSARVSSNMVVDETLRSIPEKMYLKIAEKISKKYTVIFFGYPNLTSSEDKFSSKVPEMHMREWMGLIQNCDYFVGCDSVGQHIARFLNKPGSVIMGGTNPINTSYPDHFKIFKRKDIVLYSPMRISGLQSSLSDRLNEDCINYTDEEIDSITEEIISDIELKTTKSCMNKEKHKNNLKTTSELKFKLC